MDYGTLIETLDLLVGEAVVVDVALGPTRTSRAAASGTLVRMPSGALPGHLFGVGDLFVILLDEPDLSTAHLRTFDGNDFFEVTFRLGQATLILSDPGLNGMDYQGL